MYLTSDFFLKEDRKKMKISYQMYILTKLFKQHVHSKAIILKAAM